MIFSKGVRYMLIATFVFMVMKVFVKLVPHIPAIEIILFRSVISLVICLYFLSKQKVSVWGNNKPVLVLRGLSGAFALVTYFYLLQQIPLATAATLQYIAPIFATILGIFLVKEKVTPIQWLFFAISFAGVIVVQGFDARISYFDLGIGISSALGTGLAYNFVRKLKNTEHPLVIIFYFPLVVMPIAVVWSSIVWVQPQGWDWLVLLAVGLCTQVAQFFMTKAYQAEEVSKVSILNYVGMIYALGFGWILFDETFNLMTYAGMALVLGGVILNVAMKKAKA